MRNTILQILTIAIAMASLTSCTSSTTPNSKSGAKKRIAVSLLTLEDDFFKDLQAGLEEECEKVGYQLYVEDGAKSPKKQHAQLKRFEIKLYDAVVVSPCDSASIVQSIKSLNAKNIPVFTADIAADGGDVMCHIASNNVLGGRIAAQQMARFIGGKGVVIIIDHPEVTSVQQRVEGFEAELKENFPDIKIIDKAASGGNRSKALEIARQAIQNHPNLSGIFGINDNCALGALRAVAKDSKIVIIGYDAIAEAKAEIKKGGALKADVVQNPREIGRQTIQAIHAHFQGEKIDKLRPVEVGFVDAEKLNAGS